MATATQRSTGPRPSAAPETDRGRPVRRLFVGDVMSESVVAAHEGAVFKEIVDALARNRISSVPVIDDRRRVVGVVADSDLLARLAGYPGTPRGHWLPRSGSRRKVHAATARELMTAPAVTTTAQTRISDAARRALRAGVRRLPVVDAEDRLLGVVTRTDLLRVFLRDDEDIAHEIGDHVRFGMLVDPKPLRITVEEGVVTLAGQLDRAQLVAQLVTHVRAMDGVVDVADRLTARIDDTIEPAPRVAVL